MGAFANDVRRAGPCLAGFLGLIAAFTSCTSRPSPTIRWVGTWAAAPQAAMPGALETFQDQQLRLVVHTSLGGEQIRLRFSNRFGTTPLEIGAARIARRTRDAGIDAATERTVSFDGKPSVRVAPGKDVSSDAVALAVPALGDLAITLFLPGRSEATTSHFLAQQTSYVSAPGARADSPFAPAKTIESWPFLISVDVVTPGEAAAVVVFGDSTVDGDGSTADANRRFPDYLARRYGLEPVGGVRYSVLNLGLIGNRLLRASPGAASKFGNALGAAGLDRFAPEVLAQTGVACVVLRIGINDIGFPGTFAPGDAPVTADEVIAGFRKVALAAHASRLRVVATTLAPFEGTAIVDGYYTPDKERVRQQVNTWMRSAPEFDGVIDADAVLRDPARPTRMAASLDSGDHLHPGDAGSEAVAAAAPLAACRPSGSISP